MQFRDRREAGRLLGKELARRANERRWEPRLVLALPRGGVPVGYEVALALQAPLELFMVRKLGVPGNPELAMGAIASGGTCLLNTDLIRELAIAPERIRLVVQEEMMILKERETKYQTTTRSPRDYAGQTGILVDDGAATGATMRVAIQALRSQRISRVVAGLPTAASRAAERLRAEADEVVILVESDLFSSVGQWYENFDQTSDEEVIECLREARQRWG